MPSSADVAKPIRVPLVTDLYVGLGGLDTVGALDGEYMAYMQNMVAEKTPDGRMIARLRPTLDLEVDNTTAKAKGRGLFFWSSNTTLYIINDDTIYRDSYATPVGTITTGTKKTYIDQIGSRLLITDPQNSQAWTIQTDHTLAQVTDADFPTTLAHGLTTLNGRAYVMDTSGTIYNSALEDATSWSPLDFISAERNPDGGVYIGKHHNHVVAFGSKSIEFFEDRANPTGSPLSRREDIFHNIGVLFGDGVWEVGDQIYFLGTDTSGSVALYVLENFQVSKLSSEGLGTVFHALIFHRGSSILVSGYHGDGKTIVNVHPRGYSASSDFFAYDTQTGLWSIFTSPVDGQGRAVFPLTVWNSAPSSFQSFPDPRGISSQGDVYYVLSDESLEDFGELFLGVPIVIRSGWVDGGTNKYKYCRALEVVGNFYESEDITIKYSDTDNSKTFTSPVTRTLTSFNPAVKRKLTRWGRFVRRNWQISATVNSEIRLEALELEGALGDV